MDLLLNQKQAAAVIGLNDKANSVTLSRQLLELGLKPVNQRDGDHRFYARYDLVAVQKAADKWAEAQAKAAARAEKDAEKRRIKESKHAERVARRQSGHKSDLSQFSQVLLNLTSEITALKVTMAEIGGQVAEVHKIWTDKS